MIPLTMDNCKMLARELERKYYPRPKTTKEKIEDIRESVIAYAEMKEIPHEVADALIDLLDKIVD